METPAASRPLQAGDPVIDFELRSTDGNTFSSKAARQKGLVLAVLFKTGCGTCRYSLPFLQRLHTQYAQNSGGKFQVVGISEDNRDDTLACAAENGKVTFPMLLDENLEVTEQYGLTNVPDLYLLGPEATIRYAIVGHFNRDGFNELARIASDNTGLPYTPVVLDADDAPTIKPG